MVKIYPYVQELAAPTNTVADLARRTDTERVTDVEYLRHIEHLANRVIAAHFDEHDDVFELPPDPPPSAVALRDLGLALRHYHFENDGCLEDDRPLRQIAGALIIGPNAMPTSARQTYEEACTVLGVDPRPEGWALWNTWTKDKKRVTMVLTGLDVTEGLLRSWRNGRAMWPTEPLAGQIAQVVMGWVRPTVLMPHMAERLGLGGRVAAPGDGPSESRPA